MPYALPGTVVGVAMILAWLKPIPLIHVRIYNTLWILLVAYIARYMAFGVRTISASLQQIHVSMEEAARISGATWLQTFRDIVIPLIAPGLFASWFLVFIPTLRELTGGCNHLLDLHSAGEARYLAHALFIKQEDGSLAAAAGLPFALLRRRSREGALCGTLVQAARSMGVKALALELGGGIATFREDIELGVRSVLSLLARWGYLQKELLLPRTAPDKIYLRDERKFVRAGEEGAYYPGIEVGKMVEIGKRIGVWIPLGDFKPRATVAPESGTLVYSRIRCRSHKGDTLAMLLPVQRTKEAQEE